MQAQVLAKAVLDRMWLTMIYFLVTAITTIEAAVTSSPTVGGSAFVGCALSYVGPAGFVGSFLARREKRSTTTELVGIAVIALILTSAGVWLASWSGFWMNLFGVAIAGPYWALLGSAVALIATKKKDVM